MPESSEISLLGLGWNTRDDIISIRFKVDEIKPSSVTKELALRALAQVFDPLGLVAPCLLQIKLFVQDCWKAKVDWEDPLSDIMESQFRKIMIEREEFGVIYGQLILK